MIISFLHISLYQNLSWMISPWKHLIIYISLFYVHLYLNLILHLKFNLNPSNVTRTYKHHVKTLEVWILSLQLTFYFTSNHHIKQPQDTLSSNKVLFTEFYFNEISNEVFRLKYKHKINELVNEPVFKYWHSLSYQFCW